MNILVITTLYPMWDRKNLPDGTNAIPYLLKYWVKENRVVCIRPFRHSLAKPKRFLDLKTMRNLAGGWEGFSEYGIEVYLMEYVLMPGKLRMSESRAKRFARRINGMMERIAFQPDVVIVHMPLVDDIIVYIDKICGMAPKIAVLHRGDTDMKTLRQDKELLEAKFDAVFSRNEKIRAEFSQYELKNLRKEIIYSGISNDSDPPKREWSNFSHRKKRFLYAGDLIKNKGVNNILECLGGLKGTIDFVCHIIGDGEERANLEKLAVDLGIKDEIIFCGKRERSFVYDTMKSSDIFIMVSEHETLGLVYLEAMVNGCITIGSREEGIDGIIINGINGFLVKARDTEELRKCILNIHEMPDDQIRKISEAALTTGLSFNERDMADRYYSLIKDVVDCRKTGRESRN